MARLVSALKRRSAARGAAAVEFAILVPVFLMLVMGMITLAISFNRQLGLTSAAREGSRYGATLPTGKGTIPTTWFDQIADRAVQSADGLLVDGAAGRWTCVAYIGYGSPQGSATDQTRKRVQSGGGGPSYASGSTSDPSSWCFDDGLGSNGNDRRVQVVLQRESELNAIFYHMTFSVSARGVTRFEATNPS